MARSKILLSFPSDKMVNIHSYANVYPLGWSGLILWILKKPVEDHWTVWGSCSYALYFSQNPSAPLFRGRVSCFLSFESEIKPILGGFWMFGKSPGGFCWWRWVSSEDVKLLAGSSLQGLVNVPFWRLHPNIWVWKNRTFTNPWSRGE